MFLARGAISNTQIQKGTVSMIRKRIQERESLKGQKIILEQQQTEVKVMLPMQISYALLQEQCLPYFCILMQFVNNYNTCLK